MSPVVDFASNLIHVETIPVLALLSNTILFLKNFVEAIPKGYKIKVSKKLLLVATVPTPRLIR